MVLLKQGLFSPQYLISIKDIASLDYITHNQKEGLKIGALTTHRKIEKSSIIKEKFGPLVKTVNGIGSIHIRNVGTIGGNLCHSDPSGDPAPTLIAMNAKVKAISLEGERTILLEEFFKDYYETELKEDEILTEIQIPSLPPNSFGTYTKYNLRGGGSNVVVKVAAFITMESEGKVCKDARIVLGAVGATPIRAKRAEDLLKGQEISLDLVLKVGKVASEECDPVSDVNGSEGYKREMVRVYTKNAIMECLKRAEIA